MDHSGTVMAKSCMIRIGDADNYIAMRYLLSRFYGLVTKLRVFLYEKGFLVSRHLNHPVVSVGNLTVGGTGKTPLIIFLATTLREAGYQPVVLTRGYKRKTKDPVLVVSDGKKILCNPEDSGDEPYLLATKLSGVPVIVSKNRYAGGYSVEGRYQKLIYLLDDGYQHLQLKRDLNILVLDATNPFSESRLLPLGKLREPLNALKRADTIVISRSHMFSDFDDLQVKIRKWNKVAPLAYFHHDVTGIFDARNTANQFLTRDFIGKRVIALAAIGNPQVFLHDLAHYQMEVTDQFLFRDHHNFSQFQLNQVIKRASETDAAAIITTEKDYVRLKKLNFKEGQILVLQIAFLPQDETVYKSQFLEEVRSLSTQR